MRRTMTITVYLLAVVLSIMTLTLRAELNAASSQIREMQTKIAELQARKPTVIREQVVHEVVREVVRYEQPWNTIENVRLTAYCPCAKCCGKWENGITASGVIAQEGRTVAVDPKVIPLGAEVEINGAIYIAEDTGVVGNSVDIFMNSHQAALDFGLQYAAIKWRMPKTEGET